MSSEQMRVTVPMTILTLVVSIIVTGFGYVINGTLTSINDNIKELNIKIEALTNVRYDHETRLKILEDKISKFKK